MKQSRFHFGFLFAAACCAAPVVAAPASLRGDERERPISVRNATEEAIDVWVKAFRRKSAEAKPAWTPSPPDEPTVYRFQLAAGETKVLTGEQPAAAETDAALDPHAAAPAVVAAPAGKLSASKIRIWAESESGERWTRYRDADLATNDDASSASDDEPFEFEIHLSGRERVYKDRLIKLTNKTLEPLSIRLEYRTDLKDDAPWRKLEPFEVAPGATGLPITPQGMRIRAVEIRVAGQGESLKFDEHETKGLRVVDAHDGDTAIYKAEKLGVFDYVFRPPLKPGKKPAEPAAEAKFD
ncbi:MAG: hypothetical protein JNL96_16900 [Planctomycetaceae bacterium]|nr:hypothetical protein [Planctomycetaceae bacterium]